LVQREHNSLTHSKPISSLANEKLDTSTDETFFIKDIHTKIIQLPAYASENIIWYFGNFTNDTQTHKGRRLYINVCVVNKVICLQ